ncbi:MAG: glycosyltransferase [Alphaproteobacteria bacterium]|nr:glycosyltransferase [Alphaproteobacteria bacterium]
MKKHLRLSVIVPICNVEKYLRQCLDSIVASTLKDLEIILINDGSKDNSLVIMQEYAKRDKRIKIIDKPNEGYGKTMNRGLDIAAGDYIGIVESDDWIEPDMYETLYNLAKKHKVDIAKGRFFQFDDKTGETEHLSSLPEYDAEQVINPRERPAIFTTGASIWSAIYRRDFLNDNKIRFLESPGASYQDTGFNFKVWAMAKSAYLTMKPLLHYRVGHASQSVKSKDKVFCICDEFKEIERYMADKKKKFHALEKIFNRVKYGCYKWNYNRLDGENREAFRKAMASELSEAVKNDKIELIDFSYRDRVKLQKFFQPDSIRLKTEYIFAEIGRWFVKTKNRHGMKRWYILGFFPYMETPTYLEKRKGELKW